LPKGFTARTRCFFGRRPSCSVSCRPGQAELVNDARVTRLSQSRARLIVSQQAPRQGAPDECNTTYTGCIRWLRGSTATVKTEVTGPGKTLVVVAQKRGVNLIGALLHVGNPELGHLPFGEV
jgi:hypothetical protein